MSQIKVKQKASVIGQPESMRRIVRALGLRRVGATNVVKDDNCARGMINKVKHLVSYELSK